MNDLKFAIRQLFKNPGFATVAVLVIFTAPVTPPTDLSAVLAQLNERLGARKERLQWIKATIGQNLRLIPVADVLFFQSDEKYTLVAWRGDGGKQGEAFIRTPLKGLVEQLDPQQFQQIHRSVVVNLNAVSHVTRGDNETADVFFKNRTEAMPVSRTFLHLFKAE